LFDDRNGIRSAHAPDDNATRICLGAIKGKLALTSKKVSTGFRDHRARA
jgi:hypothetical protein